MRPGWRRSLSLRRAWIEITCTMRTVVRPLSLSLRRAWIEIRIGQFRERIKAVALLTESVD